MSANGYSPAAAATPRSRLPRWTRHETLVLIQAKRAMEQRGLRSPQPVRLKWAVVSSYCRRHGVERGPMQCRKRWGNLSWDLKKIVAWEKNGVAAAAAAGIAEAPLPPPPQQQQQHESFWDMRGEQRRARQLPSSFDREVYDALVGPAAELSPDFEEELSRSYDALVGAAAKLSPDSGDDLAEGDEADEQPPMMVMPISARMCEPPASSEHECSDPATESAKKAGAASDKNSTSQQDSEATFGAGVGTGAEAAAAATMSIGKQVIESLEKGNRMLADQLEAQKASWDMDREHRKALLAAFNKLADAVGRIADKL